MPAPKYRTHCPQGHEYTLENTGEDRKGRYCRICKRARYKTWHSLPSSKERRAAYWKEWKYKLTPEAYKVLFDKQNGVCALCPNPIEHIDHDHKTNQIRGLLCQKCNRGLGHFNDDPQLLRLAADYVDRIGKFWSK